MRISARPALVKNPYTLTFTPPLPNGQRHYWWIFREVRSAQQAEIARFGQTSIGSPKHSVHSASSRTTPPYAPPRVPFMQRRFTAAALPPAPAPHMLHPPQPCETPAPAAPAPPPRPDDLELSSEQRNEMAATSLTSLRSDRKRPRIATAKSTWPRASDVKQSDS